MRKKTKVKQLVKLREKELAHGYIRLYLDIYVNGKRWTETLKDMQYKVNPRTTEERNQRAEVLSLAESIRMKKESMILYSNYGQVSPHLRSKDFIEYYQSFLDNYTNKDKRLVKYSLEKFKEYLGKNHISFGALTEALLIGYKKFLDEKLNGETPYNYFTKTKRVIKQAYKDGYLPNNPAEDIKNMRNEGVKKDILTFDEVKKLDKTSCLKDDVKRGFLFCFNTGLRFCDVENLKWGNIYDNMIVIQEQQKTKKPVNIHLNKNARKYLGERKDNSEKVFDFPSFTYCLIILKDWAKDAGILKNITWHSARHSLATHLVSNGIPVNIVGGLLGHSGLKHTQKYIRYVDEMGKAAINSIPLLDD